jgi:hypothetical protein
MGTHTQPASRCRASSPALWAAILFMRATSSACSRRFSLAFCSSFSRICGKQNEGGRGAPFSAQWLGDRIVSASNTRQGQMLGSDGSTKRHSLAPAAVVRTPASWTGHLGLRLGLGLGPLLVLALVAELPTGRHDWDGRGARGVRCTHWRDSGADLAVHRSDPPQVACRTQAHPRAVPGAPPSPSPPHTHSHNRQHGKHGHPPSSIPENQGYR